MSFPERFTWGVAAASYQIEGAAAEDGKGPSVWDAFTRQPGRILDGSGGHVACDHYHRFPEDVALMRDLGVPAYRLSVSWPRVLPQGAGEVNEAGLAFYDRLVDTLLAAGIEPWVTLFHWDYPQALFLRGGWLNPDSPGWFAAYAQRIVERLSDRVTHWMTINEPQCFVLMGHQDGEQVHAPGLNLRRKELLTVAHHVLLGHGLAVQAIRAHARRPPQVGWAMTGHVGIPASDDPRDIEAARAAMFRYNPAGLWSPALFADPPLLGAYPSDMLEAFGPDAPEIRDGDLDILRQPLDFYGANIYSGTTYRAGEDGAPVVVPHPQGYPRTTMGWPVTPGALYWGPRFLAERYGLPVVITENGVATTDWPALDGTVHDPGRVDYLRRHLRALRRACEDGVPVQGYFQWSLMDNFEWQLGYTQRFGLMHVDYATQRRTPKTSAAFYREVIASNGGVL